MSELSSRLKARAVALETDANDMLSQAADIRAAALALDDVQPPPPPPPPPPPEDKLLPSRGARLNGLDYSTGRPADLIHASKIPSAIPWDVFTDDKLTIARPLNGVAPAAQVRWHVYGHDARLYEGTLRMHEGVIVRAYHNSGAEPWQGAAFLRRTGPLGHRPGKRGESIMSPYTTWHGHTRRDGDVLHASPHIPMWIGITLNGIITYAMRDGSSVDAFVVPIDEDSWTNDFCFYEPDRKLLFVTDTPKGRILRIDRKTTPWTVSVLCEGLGDATSVRAVGEKLYVASFTQDCVWEIDADTGSKRECAKVSQAFWVDYFSDGMLCVMTQNRTAHAVDPTSGVVGPNLLQRVMGAAKSQPWVMVDVDRNGTCGQRDALIAISVTGVSNVDVHRVLRDGTPAGFTVANGVASVGAVMHISDPYGHYPWVITHHPDDGCFMVQGLESVAPQILCSVHPDDHWDQPGATWKPAANDRRIPAWDVGLLLLTRSDKLTYPSFAAQINACGGGIITADHIAEMSFEDQRQFWLQGGIGSFPRAWTKEQVRAVALVVSRNSMRYRREGASFIDALDNHLSQ